MTRTILGLTLALAITSTALAHNGRTGYIPAWPAPSTLVLDGEEDDWGWLDTDSFGIKPEEIASSLGEHAEQGPNPNPEDFSASAFMAWSPPPDNAFYFFGRAQDDTLRALEAKSDWWNDDTLQLQYDFDHSAGNYLSEFENGYRHQLHPLGSKTEGAAAPPFSEEEGPLNWGGWPPYTYVNTTILPAGAVHNQTDVEYTFEVRTSPFASYSKLGPDESVPWVFEPESIIHFNFRWDDGDRDANGEQDLWNIVGDSYLCAREGEDCPDFILVPTDMLDPYPEWQPTGDEPGPGPATAVENSTWGRIKSHISN